MRRTRTGEYQPHSHNVSAETTHRRDEYGKIRPRLPTHTRRAAARRVSADDAASVERRSSSPRKLVGRRSTDRRRRFCKTQTVRFTRQFRGATARDRPAMPRYSIRERKRSLHDYHMTSRPNRDGRTLFFSCRRLSSPCISHNTSIQLVRDARRVVLMQSAAKCLRDARRKVNVADSARRESTVRIVKSERVSSTGLTLSGTLRPRSGTSRIRTRDISIWVEIRQSLSETRVAK